MWSTKNRKIVFTQKAAKNKRKHPKSEDFRCISGAAGRIRTADLILTKDALYLLSYSSKLATRKGLEPSTSGVTGRRSNQLNYRANLQYISNGKPSKFNGRGRRIRTLGTRFWRPMLYQLSYTPVWWAFRDSNPGPTGYEPAALTN